ncbi:MAG: molybdopterin-synthase adenylyltransferase MoeB [Bacteroidetes bacterium]|nr:molybdopterin-synthase adenylyltransferase MoeB [Bacteroidota bacterium]
MLSSEEQNRYSRHIIMPEIGIEGQEKLKQAKVLVVGAGGLGCPVLQYLTAAGVGTIGIVDDDVVDESNLQRQILFSSEDIGKSKVEVASKKLSLLNPHCQLPTANCRLSSANALEIIKDYDLIIDGSDNFPTRYLVNDACVMLNKPLVFGSIFKFEGQVSVFNYRNGPTYRCLFPEPPVDSPNCAEIGVLGVLPGIVGTLMTNEALKIILGIGSVLSGKLFVMDALNCQTQIISFGKNLENFNIKSFTDYDAFCTTPLSFGRGVGGEVKQVSVYDLKKLFDSKTDFQLIDVREVNEYKLSNIKGENIPLGSVEKNTDRISRSKQVIIHCKSGARSKKAIELLQQKYGFTNLYNLTGGIDAWNKMPRP